MVDKNGIWNTAVRHVCLAVNEGLLKHMDARLVRRSVAPNSTFWPFPADTWVIAELANGTRLWVDLGDRGVSAGCIKDSYEASESQFVDRNLHIGDTFVDIGANIGWFTVRAAQRVGIAGRIVAVEPRSNTFQRLVMTVKENAISDRVELHHAALSATPGVLHIGWDDTAGNPGGTWTLPTAAMSEDFRKGGHRVEEVDVRTLDDVVGDRRVDLIKIDVEGAEGLVFRGGTQTLRRCRPTILSEINFELLPIISGMTAEQYVRWVCDIGYRCHRLHEGHAGPELAPDCLPTETDLINVVFQPT